MKQIIAYFRKLRNTIGEFIHDHFDFGTKDKGGVWY